MMLTTLIDWCIAQGVTLRLDGDNVKLGGNTKALDKEKIAAIKALKAELVEWLQHQAQQQASKLQARKQDPMNIPASFAQQRLWFIDQLEGAGPRYNLCETIRIQSPFDLAVAERAFNALLERHQPLRTVFVEQDNRLLQRVQDDCHLSIEQVNLSEVADSEQQLHQALQQRQDQGFDLASDVMMRVSYYHLADNDGVLQVILHHIASDGWSMQIMMQEFTALYQAFAQGGDNPLAALELHYSDYAAWQRDYLTDERLAEQLDYWQQQLLDAPSEHALPLDKPRGEQQTVNGANVEFALSEDTCQKLEQLAVKANASLFMVIHSALALLVARYGNDNDVVIGTPFANRDGAVENLIGFFVNTLVLRTDCSGNPSYQDFLAQVRETNLAAQAHHHVPFDVLVEKLNPHRSAAISPFFQIAFSMENKASGGTADATGSELVLAPLHGDNHLAHFELTFRASRLNDSLAFVLEYNTDLFNRATIERLAGGLRTLLCAIADDPHCSIGQLPVLDEAHKTQLQQLMHGAKHDHIAAGLVHQRVAQLAQQNPDAIAVSDENGELSYGELNTAANQLAHLLLAREIGAGDSVAVYMNRSREMVVALLAILKAGAAYLPLDVSYPEERLEGILDDAEPQLVLTQSDLAGEIHFTDLMIVPLGTDLDDPWLVNFDDNEPEVEVSPQDIAYVIFTSGSTGKPKGVANSHQALANLVGWHQACYQLNQDSTGTLLASVGFDAAVWELWPYITAGGEVKVVSDALRISEALLIDWLDGQSISHTFLPTALYDTLTSKGLFELKSLQYVFVGGEALNNGYVPASASFKLVNHYGPTEAAVVASSFELPAEFSEVPPIGRGIDNVTLAVMDEYGQPAPLGSVGELYIGGLSLAQGYVGRDDLTQAAFVNTDLGRMYRSGDFVHYQQINDNWSICYDYRDDQQVKIRGVRMELGEINHALTEHPQVQSAVVQALANPQGQKELVAYVVPTTDESRQGDLTTILRADLKQALPSHMVPAVYVIMTAMPKTHHGKIDLNALPQPSDDDRVVEYQAPVGDTEQALAEIWADLLSLPSDLVGRNAQFFEIGGHSLLSIQLVNRVAEQMDKTISVMDVFESASLADLAIAVDGATAQGDDCIEVLPRVGEGFELSFAQQRLWFIDQMGQGGKHYNIPLVTKLNGDVDIQRLERTFIALVERHEILRTTFKDTEQGPRQYIQSSDQLLVEHHDLTASTESAEQIIEAAVSHTFDLAFELPTRVTIVQLSDDSAILVVNLHHIVADGWSMSILIKEFNAIYQALKTEQPCGLPQLAVQYADFATWQRNWLAGERLQQQLHYWQDQLAELPACHALPLDKPRPAEQTFVGDCIDVQLAKATTDKLNALAQSSNSSLFMVLHSALSVLLARYAGPTDTGKNDIVIGTPFANRTNSQIEPLIGFFVNTLVLRTEVDSEQTFDQLLSQVKTVNQQAQQHQDIPFEYLVEQLNPVRDASISPLFQIAFNLNTPTPQSEQTGANLSRVEETSITTKFDLTFNAEPNDQGLLLNLEYNIALFDRATIERMAKHWCVLLQSIAENGQCLVDELNMIDGAEREHLITDVNQPLTMPVVELTMSQLVNEHITQRPDAVAVVSDEASLTYGELGVKSTQVAAQLVAAIAGRDEQQVPRIAVAMHRGVDLIAAIVGIIKAGCAYVPIDVNAPVERVEYLLQDSQAELLITERSEAERFAGKSLLLAEDIFASEASNDELVVDASVDDLAYIIYTSGSTGQPKGVMQSQHSVIRLLSGTQQDFGFGSDDVWAMCSSCAFDVSVWEIWGALLHGGTLAVPSLACVQDPELMTQFMLDHQVSMLSLTPSVFKGIAEQVVKTEAQLPDLSHVVLCGEASQLDNLKAWWQHMGVDKPRIINMYGITETTVHSTFQHLTPDLAGISNVGHPLTDQAIYLLDEQLRVLPHGAIGEIYVGGAGLAQGYWQMADKTDAVFITNPYATEQMKAAGLDRLYKSGDLARWLNNNQLDYYGRKDKQVKINGFRIELGEVETAMALVTGVVQAGAIVIETDIGKRLIGCYETDSELSEQSLRAELSAKLPNYLVPHRLLQLDKLPKTMSGKLDHRVLTQLATKGMKREYQAPQGELEVQLAEVWSHLVDVTVDQISRDDNFFELGGHSLSAIRLVAEINQHSEQQISVKHLFQYPVLSDLAGFLTALNALVHEQEIDHEDEEQWL